jgi:hypothetical protein
MASFFILSAGRFSNVNFLGFLSIRIVLETPCVS